MNTPVCNYIFFRDQGFYTLAIPEGTLQDNIDSNPGTLRVELAATGEVVWEKESPITTPCASCGREEEGKWVVPCPSDDCPSNNKLRLTLTLTVDYDRNGVNVGALKSNLVKLVGHGVDNGMLTGDSDATVELWDLQIAEG